MACVYHVKMAARMARVGASAAHERRRLEERVTTDLARFERGITLGPPIATQVEQRRAHGC